MDSAPTYVAAIFPNFVDVKSLFLCAERSQGKLKASGWPLVLVSRTVGRGLAILPPTQLVSWEIRSPDKQPIYPLQGGAPSRPRPAHELHAEAPHSAACRQPGKRGQLGHRAGAAPTLKSASDSSILEQVPRCRYFTGPPPTLPASRV